MSLHLFLLGIGERIGAWAARLVSDAMGLLHTGDDDRRPIPLRVDSGMRRRVPPHRRQP